MSRNYTLKTCPLVFHVLELSKHTTHERTLKNLFILLFLLGIVSYQSHAQENSDSENYIQKRDRFSINDNFQPLSLNEAIEQGLRQNSLEKTRKYERDLLEINWENTKDTFWLPQLKLTLSSGEQRIARLRRGSLTGNGTSRTPSGSLGLELGDYTIFNWGKDYLAYLNEKKIFEREDESLKEKRRNLKHQIIAKFFELNLKEKQVASRKAQLRHASFVYRYNREKVTQRKVTKQEYYQSRTEYLSAQNDYYQTVTSQDILHEEMANLLGDKPATKYLLRDDLNYKKLKITPRESMRIGNENNPNILDAQTLVDNAQRSYEIAVKESLPLPKFSVNLGAYQYKFGNNRGGTRYETRLGDSNLDVVATVNATWSLTGDGGFFNQRRTTASHIEKQLSFSKLAGAKQSTSSQIQNSHKKIQHYENQISIYTARFSTVQKTFDTVLENYLNRKTTFLDFQDALHELINTDLSLEEFKFLHLKEKVYLAQTIGVEDFPGDNFENLATSRVDKDK